MRWIVILFLFVTSSAFAQDETLLQFQKTCFAAQAENNGEYPADIKESCETIKAEAKRLSDADDAKRKQDARTAINNAAKSIKKGSSK